MSRRSRVDVLLVERGLATTRAKAQALVLAGEVSSRGVRVDKPGQAIALDADLVVTPRRRFVSRGGDKLDAALDAFGPRFADLAGVVAVDVGASTGGFTDCLLARGAARVFAVDVGWGQLDGRLRGDPRVVTMERTNARDLDAASFDAPIDLVVVDASFIGLGKLLPAIGAVLRSRGELVALVKPQFEVGREAVSRTRGVVRDEGVRGDAIARVGREIVDAGFELCASVDSAVPGPKGNVEHFVYAVKRD